MASKISIIFKARFGTDCKTHLTGVTINTIKIKKYKMCQNPVVYTYID